MVENMRNREYHVLALLADRRLLEKVNKGLVCHGLAVRQGSLLRNLK